MFKETSILLLSSMLLIQLAYCAPVKDDSSSSASSEEDSNTTERDRLYINMIITGFTGLFENTFDDEIKFLQKLLDDENLKSTKSENMEKFRHNITTLINEVDKIPKVDKNKTPKEKFVTQLLAVSNKADIVSDFEKLIDQHDPEKVAEPTVDDYLIQKALIRIGWKNFEGNVDDKLAALGAKVDDFSNLFSEDAAEYINKLSSEEKVPGDKLIGS